MLIPLDGSAFAEGILDAAIAAGSDHDGEYILLRVVPPPAITDPFPDLATWVDHAATVQDLQADIASARAAAARYLATVAEKWRGRGATITTVVVADPRPAHAILAYAAAAGADLIALATHGRSGLSRAFVGSVADKVVRGSMQPVLIRRPDHGPARETVGASTESSAHGP